MVTDEEVVWPRERVRRCDGGAGEERAEAECCGWPGSATADQTADEAAEEEGGAAADEADEVEAELEAAAASAALCACDGEVSGPVDVNSSLILRGGMAGLLLAEAE